LQIVVGKVSRKYQSQVKGKSIQSTVLKNHEVYKYRCSWAVLLASKKIESSPKSPKLFILFPEKS
jgi:hypothetical protein